MNQVESHDHTQEHLDQLDIVLARLSARLNSFVAMANAYSEKSKENVNDLQKLSDRLGELEVLIQQDSDPARTLTD